MNASSLNKKKMEAQRLKGGTEKQRLTQFHSREFHKITKMEGITYMNRTCAIKRYINQNKIN